MKFTQDLAVEYAEVAATSLAGDLVETDPYDGDHLVPGELRHFLASLRLLHGVPFSYLVPDAEQLPPESIRFFYVDRNWTDALVQGALSVGTVTTTDRAQLETVYPQLRDEVDETERTVRVPQHEERLSASGGTITGFLLRSRAVSGWPALHVRAYSRDLLEDDALTTEAESHPERMKLLRMERLAPSVLLVLIDGVPAVVHIEEPRHGIQFGARMDTDAPATARRAEVHLRDATTGKQLEPQTSIPVPFRSGAPGVIDLRWLRDRMAEVDAANIPEPVETHHFALEMLRFPYRQVFGEFDEDGLALTYHLDQFHVTTAPPVEPPVGENWYVTSTFDEWEDALIAQLEGTEP